MSREIPEGFLRDGVDQDGVEKYIREYLEYQGILLNAVNFKVKPSQEKDVKTVFQQPLKELCQNIQSYHLDEGQKILFYYFYLYYFDFIFEAIHT